MQKNHRFVEADAKSIKGKLDKYFNFCVSASRAYLLLRNDHMEHLKTVRAECGFRYVRFHGLLQDDLGIYRLDKSGEPIYSWQYCDEVYDHILDIGMKPFVVFDFMPEVLASGEKTIYWEKSNITPPVSYERWYDLIYKITLHFTHRYGVEEVKSWLFEVWNEPDGWFFDGNKEEYFKLYEYTARAVKEVCVDYQVGGPSVAGAYEWLPELADYCKRKNIPLDFVTAHTYCVDEFEKGKKSDADRHVPTWKPGTPWGLSNLKLVPENAINNVEKTVELLNKHRLSGTDIHFTEWGLTYCYWDPLHDTYQAPSHMLHVLKKCMNKVKSMSFCEVSDVFEEDGPPIDNFHGGFGLMNLQGIRKPSFYAYKFLNMLGDTELNCDDENTIVCQNDDGYQILTWNCDNNQDAENILYFGQDRPPLESESVTIKIQNLENGNYGVKIYAVGYGKNDAYTEFLSMEYRDSLSRKQVEHLRSISDGRELDAFDIRIEDGTFTYSVEMSQNDVYMFVLHKSRYN